MVNCVLPRAFPDSLTSQLLVFMKGNYISFVSCHVRVFKKGKPTILRRLYYSNWYLIVSYQFSHMVVFNTERKKDVSDYCHFTRLY